MPDAESTRAILTALPPHEGIVTANFGRRRMAADRIAPGGDVSVYANVQTALQNIKAAASGIGTPISRLIVSWIHGHADRSMAKGDYRRMLKSLHAHLQRDAAGAAVMICASQTCAAQDASDRTTPADVSPIANAYLVTAQKHPQFFLLACPEYILARTFDGVHLTPPATALLGAYHGRAIAKRLSSVDWAPLQMAHATRDGNVVRVQFIGGTGPLVFHNDDGTAHKTWGMRNLENHGFVWRQSGANPAHIKRLKITGPREITIILSSIPRKPATEFLSLGLFPPQSPIEGFIKGRPSTGGGLGTNIRTQSDDLDHFGTPLHDWALLQEIPVTPV